MGRATATATTRSPSITPSVSAPRLDSSVRESAHERNRKRNGNVTTVTPKQRKSQKKKTRWKTRSTLVNWSVSCHQLGLYFFSCPPPLSRILSSIHYAILSCASYEHALLCTHTFSEHNQTTRSQLHHSSSYPPKNDMILPSIYMCTFRTFNVSKISEMSIRKFCYSSLAKLARYLQTRTTYTHIRKN